MLPDPLHGSNDRRTAGKVFAFRLVTAGGMIRSDRQVEVNREEWDDCLRCPEFEHCYKLCLAKLRACEFIAGTPICVTVDAYKRLILKDLYASTIVHVDLQPINSHALTLEAAIAGA